MNKRVLATVGALAVSITLSLPAAAEPGGKHGHGGGQNHSMERGEPSSRDVGGAVADVLITAAERALIGEYYQSHSVPVDSLPPGIRKKVARGKPLPPGIAKKFPDGLHGQLRARPGYDFRTVGADVVLVEAATGVIVDVIKDILR
ncbi:MAG: anti-virulence regulator CigR family protein [Bacteroidales bacterium]